MTLAGFASGTSLETVQDLVADWLRHVPPLPLEVEGAAAFPPPFQVAVLKMAKAPALFAALVELRRHAERRRLTLSTVIPAEQWVFHMSLAYCSKLSAAQWGELTQFLETVHVPSASCVQETVEIVAFDDGREYSGGIHSLARQAARGWRTRSEP